MPEISDEDFKGALAAADIASSEAEIKGPDPAPATQITTQEAAAKAMANALELPLFDNHTQGLAGALIAEDNKLQRALGTINDRRVQAQDVHRATVAALDQQLKKTLAELDAETRDTGKAHAAINAALDALQKT